MVKNDTTALHQLVQDSNKIIIFSHIRPDPDAVASAVFLNNLFKYNFPDKEILANIEGEINEKMSVLPNVNDIQNKNSFELVSKFRPNLIVMLDACNFNRISGKEGVRLKEFVKENDIKLVILDHHGEAEADESQVYLNYNTASTAELLYKIFVEELGYKPFTDLPNTVMVGLLSDTGGFKYKLANPKETMRIASIMMEQGSENEKILDLLTSLTENEMKVFTEMANNFVCGDEYNYTTISEEFLNKHNGVVTSADIYEGYHQFMDSRLRSTGKANWGFVIFKDMGKPDKTSDGKYTYKGSFRSTGNVDTRPLAAKMSGGGAGIKNATGFEVLAKNDKEALNEVLNVIEKYKHQAYEKGN